jgi:DNA polymerase delta subunit 3
MRYCYYPLETTNYITWQNLQVLSDVKREITTKYADEDPLKVGQQYGTICNPHVRRRTGGRPVLPMPSTSASKAKPEPLAKAPAVKPAPKTENQPQIKAEAKQPQIKSETQQPQIKTEPKQPQIKAEPRPEPTKLHPRKPPPMKKEISDMFKSFAKPKPKATADSSVDTTPAPGTPQSETANGPPDGTFPPCLIPPNPLFSHKLTDSHRTNARRPLILILRRRLRRRPRPLQA